MARKGKQYVATYKDGEGVEEDRELREFTGDKALGNGVRIAILADPQLQDATAGLAKLVIKEAANVLLHGTQRDKAALVAKFMPYIAKTLMDEGSDHSADELRNEFEKMRQEMTSTGAGGIPQIAPGADADNDDDDDTWGIEVDENGDAT